MSSDEDDGYSYSRRERRHDESPSNGTRQRSSGYSRRHRSRYGHPHSHKSRRSRSWFSYNTARLITVSVFAFLAAYEVFILKNPILSETKPIYRTTTHFTDSGQPSHSEPATPQSHPVSAPAAPANDTNQEPQAAISASPLNIKSRALRAEHESATSTDGSRATMTPSGVIMDVPADTDEQQERSSIGSAALAYHPLKKHRHMKKEKTAVPRTIAPMTTASHTATTSHTTTASHTATAPHTSSTETLSVSKSSGTESDDTMSSSTPDIRNEGSRRQSSTSAIGNNSEHSVSPSGESRHKGTTAKSSPAPNAAKREKGADPGAGENFWQWFQETKENEKHTVSGSLKCPEENKRLCQMIYKYLRKYKIRTMYDTSCVKNLNWISEILKKIGSEMWGFKYYCSIPNEGDREKASGKLKDVTFVEFVTEQWWRSGFATDTELLFAWDTLPHIAYGRVWNFFVKAKKQQIKYVLVDNYPGIMNDPSPKREFINIRKHPFRFPAAKEVVQNVTEPGEIANRQLLFYESAMLPENLQ